MNKKDMLIKISKMIEKVELEFKEDEKEMNYQINIYNKNRNRLNKRIFYTSLDICYADEFILTHLNNVLTYIWKDMAIKAFFEMLFYVDFIGANKIRRITSKYVKLWKKREKKNKNAA